MDGKISLDEYLSGISAFVSGNGTKPRRNREEIQADILLLDPADIAAVIAFSAECGFNYPAFFRFKSDEILVKNLAHSTSNSGIEPINGFHKSLSWSYSQSSRSDRFPLFLCLE